MTNRDKIEDAYAAAHIRALTLLEDLHQRSRTCRHRATTNIRSIGATSDRSNHLCQQLAELENHFSPPGKTDRRRLRTFPTRRDVGHMPRRFFVCESFAGCRFAGDTGQRRGRLESCKKTANCFRTSLAVFRNAWLMCVNAERGNHEKPFPTETKPWPNENKDRRPSHRDATA